MNQPDLIRRHIDNYLLRLRSFASMVPNNTGVVDLLRGDDGERRRARIINFIMSELGHETYTPVEDPNSRVRRTVSRVREPRGTQGRALNERLEREDKG